MKICKGCKKEKAKTLFGKHKGRKENLADLCRECRNPKVRAKNHNISVDELHRMLMSQMERCAICWMHKSKFQNGLAVDHNHKTGKIRGLLCHKCNIAIGHFQEDVFRLKAAIEYLEKNK